MAFKACFSCELLFEVQDEASASSPCPSCGGSLEAYVPSEDELAEADFNEPAHTASLAADSNIVATMAVEGLAAQVRARVMAEEAAAAGLLTSETTDPEPASEPAAPRAKYGQPVRRKTKVASIDEAAALLLEPTRPTPAAPAPHPTPVAAQPARVVSKPAPVGGAKRVAVAVPAPAPAPPAGPAPAPAPQPPKPFAPPKPASAPDASSGGARGKRMVVVGALVCLGLGGGAWLMMRGDGGGDTPGAAADAGPPKAAWPEAVKAQLEAGQAMLPVVGGSETFAEGPYVAGGPEGLGSSNGIILGLASTNIPNTAVQTDENGEWVGALLTALKRAGAAGEEAFAFALDGQVPVRNLQRMAYATSKAGYGRFLLVVGREEAPGELGGIPFALHTGDGPDAVHIRVGVLGFRVQAPGQPAARVARTDSGALDLTALGKLLDTMPSGGKAVVYPIGEMKLARLASLLSVVRRGEKDRLPDVSLSIR